jgi:Xaa-Pro aminopeptidase
MNGCMPLVTAWLILCLAWPTSTFSIVRAAEFPATEFQARRELAMQSFSGGILLLHARSTLKHDIEHGLQQNPNFYYFTGLGSAISAILAIDGRAKESWLFVPRRLSGVAGTTSLAFVEPGEKMAAQLGLDHVVDWEEFSPYLERHVKADSNLKIYLEDAGFDKIWLAQESNPTDLAPIANHHLLWRRALETRWPGLRIESATRVLHELRFVKSYAEIEVLRRVAQSSVAALLAGLRGLRPGRWQREVEAEVVCECVRQGAEGPSFWPWVMSGPNAVFPAPFASFVDYHHLNRIMQAGELVRVDVGCDREFYKGDVGRTAPVSGTFTPEQRETWELLVGAYRAGVAVMHHGISKKEIFAASRGEIARHREHLETALARRAAQEILAKGEAVWHIHGVGLESAEPLPDTLRAGMVLAYEPGFAIGTQAFYLEDMILITASGYEILTKELPYSAVEIEEEMGETNRPLAK